MQTIINKLKIIAYISGLILIFSPQLASAVASGSPTQTPSLFCTNLANKYATDQSNLNNLKTKVNTAISQRQSTLASNWQNWDQKLAADRATWQTDRQTEFSALQAKATTTSEKTAVSNFISTVTNAITTRESANDQARQQYRTAVTTIITNQSNLINSQISTFSQSIQTADSTAQSACAVATESGSTIRTAFVASLQTAHATFTAERQSDSTIKTEIAGLASTRDNAITANDATFKSTLDSALNNLKSAFPSNS